jgi:cobalt-zinc-cadmium efflux system outer membrane protein
MPEIPPIPSPLLKEHETTPEPAGILTLPQTLALVLEKSPALAAYAWDLRWAEARELQASLRPNPEAGVTTENVLGTGDFRAGREAETTLRLSQLVELGGKRAKRREAAGLGRELVGVDYERRRVDVLVEATETFLHVVADQERLRLAEQEVSLAKAVLAATRKRLREGSGSPQEEHEAAALLARAGIEQEHAEHEMASTRRKLASLWGSDTPIFQEARADLYARGSIPSLEALADRIRSSPEITRWVTEERLRRAEADLAEARRTSDLRVGGGIRRLEGPDEQAFVLELAMPLPLFDRGQGAAAEARALSGKARAEREHTERRLRAALFELYQELRHSETELAALEQEIIPAAEAALAHAVRAHEQGGISEKPLLDARDTLLHAQKERLEAAALHHQRVVEIERLLGEPLSERETP